jgi:hypothetical protein
MAEMRNADDILVRKPDRKVCLGDLDLGERIK